MGDYKEAPYFYLSTKSGKQYIAKIEANRYGIGLTEDSDGKMVIDELNPEATIKFIKIENCFEIILTRVGNDVQPIPVQYTKTATGSSAVLIGIDDIGVINCLDENSEAVKAIRAIDSGIIPATAGDIEKSSEIIHKFSNRGK